LPDIDVCLGILGTGSYGLVSRKPDNLIHSSPGKRRE